jgi:branched-chain amino acid transport system substrate-binding protein
MVDVARIALVISTRIHGPADTLPTYRGFALAMEDIAAARPAGARPIEWRMFDDHGDTDLTRKLAAEIVADPSYVAAVGPMGSSEAFANAPIFDEAGLLQVSPCASHPDLCRRGYRTFFRLVPNEEVQGRELARVARHVLGAARVAIVHDEDAFGTTVADNFARGFTDDLGGTIAVRASFSEQQDTYAEVAAAVAAAGADVVFFGVHSHGGKLVSSAIRAAGVTAPFLGTDGLKTSFYLGGGDDGEAYHTHTGADFRRLPSAAALRDAYVARWPEDSTYSPEAYDSALLAVRAIDAATELTRPAVLEAFRALGPQEGVTGTIRFDATGERLGSPVSLYRVTLDADGQREMSYQGTTDELAAA